MARATALWRPVREIARAVGDLTRRRGPHAPPGTSHTAGDLTHGRRPHAAVAQPLPVPPRCELAGPPALNV